MEEITHIRAVRKTMSQRLFIFSIVSILVGVSMYWIPADQMWRKLIGAVAIQFIIWGAIDLMFAIPGVMGARRLKSDPQELEERVKMIRILRFNNKLNWLWISIGAALLGIGVALSWWHVLVGHGVGVLAQGGFLFFFDRAFLLMLENTKASTSSSSRPNQ